MCERCMNVIAAIPPSRQLFASTIVRLLTHSQTVEGQWIICVWCPVEACGCSIDAGKAEERDC